MQLSKRLNAVANMVTTRNKVADIGCDHAYTSIYLAEHEIAPKIIAMDVNQGPIDKAKENILKFGYQDIIEVRKSNGLEMLQIGEADTILIAGMGGGLMVQILSEKPVLVKNVCELILQPQSELHRVRRMLEEIGFLIINENMVMEDGKYYVIMKAVGQDKIQEKQTYVLNKKEHYHYGRLLLEQCHPVLQEFLLWELDINQHIMENLEAERTINALSRQKEIAEKIELIQCGLDYFRQRGSINE